jgi:hypothetical protein
MRTITLLFAIFLGCSVQSQEPKRVALVIGVNDYKYASILKNTINDAVDISNLLKKKNFDVIELYNPPSKKELKDAVIQYFGKLKGNTVGMLYYSGHGIQVDGTNYLIPTNADPQIKADLDDQCLSMEYIMAAIEEAGNPLNIFVLDACRNNPFRSFYRTGEKGLSLVSSPKGSYIVYATKPGSVASDGSGRNGLFTSKLLQYIDSEGLNIEQVFKKVAGDVAAESGDSQRPWIASDYTGDFYFTASGNRGRPQSVMDPATSIFHESFDHNENKWYEGDDDRHRIGFNVGSYTLHSKKGGTWYSTIPVATLGSKDFEISATMSKKSGTDGYYFGLILGLDVKTGYYHFAGVTGWGNFVYASKGPKPEDSIPTRDNLIVNKGNSTNYLMVKKTGNIVALFLNGQKVGETSYQVFYGDRFGFQIWSGNETIEVEFDNLQIKTFN